MTELEIQVLLSDVDKAVAVLPFEYGERRWPHKVITGDLVDKVYFPKVVEKVIYQVPAGKALIQPINVGTHFDFESLLREAGVKFEVVRIKYL